jgi:hypothetical protein
VNIAAEALAAVDRALESSGDADDILREVVTVLVEQGGCSWAGILFAEEGELVLGPEAGTPDSGSRTQIPVVFQGNRVAELVVDGCHDPEFLDRVALTISPYCLVGWDTGGLPWDPAT